VQLTPYSSSVVADGTSFVNVDPFQRDESEVGPPVDWEPTTMQFVVLVHETPEPWLVVVEIVPGATVQAAWAAGAIAAQHAITAPMTNDNFRAMDMGAHLHALEYVPSTLARPFGGTQPVTRGTTARPARFAGTTRLCR
jgi:hypothetical protein